MGMGGKTLVLAGLGSLEATSRFQIVCSRGHLLPPPPAPKHISSIKTCHLEISAKYRKV